MPDVYPGRAAGGPFGRSVALVARSTSRRRSSVSPPLRRFARALLRESPAIRPALFPPSCAFSTFAVSAAVWRDVG